jgi:hypothetical protein
MKISAAKNQVLQSIAEAFPCNAVLHKWGVVPSAACSIRICCHAAERQSHIQCLCPALKEAWIRAHLPKKEARIRAQKAAWYKSLLDLL